MPEEKLAALWMGGVRRSMPAGPILPNLVSRTWCRCKLAAFWGRPVVVGLIAYAIKHKDWPSRPVVKTFR
jgi:hypothetical protein